MKVRYSEKDHGQLRYRLRADWVVYWSVCGFVLLVGIILVIIKKVWA